MPEMILPGTYIEVRDEGLISAGRIATGNIGIVGTAAKGPVNQVQLVSSLAEARDIFGESGEWINKDQVNKNSDNVNNLTLIRALTLIYKTGGRNVYAVRTTSGTEASRASVTLTASGDGSVLTLIAKTPGTWGNGIGITITLGKSSTSPVDQPAVSSGSGENSVADGEDGTSPSDSEAATKDSVEGSPPLITLPQESPTKKMQAVLTTSSGSQEVYVFDNVGELSQLINANSNSRVTATSPSTVKTNVIPDTGTVQFTGGTDGAEATSENYQASLNLLKNEDVNIVLLAGQVSNDMVTVLDGHLTDAALNKRERIGIVGSDFGTINSQHVRVRDDGRLIFTAPGVLLTENGKQNKLPGGYLAAAVAGLISSLPVHSSPTNKVLSIEGLTTVFNHGQLQDLVKSHVCAVEHRNGFRIVKGITTSAGAWQQITTRRIVDYAIYGIRSSCDPYIGKLNNERVRGAMKATLDGFLTRMVEDEALVSYQLEVSATRAQEIAGEAAVTVTLGPTFSIDFIKVTMYLG